MQSKESKKEDANKAVAGTDKRRPEICAKAELGSGYRTPHVPTRPPEIYVLIPTKF
jgi:hypothetical protein